jgi:putative sugar O-methyltransferase
MKTDNYCTILDALALRSKEVGEIYLATPFWEAAENEIVSDMRTVGLQKFRSWPSALSFFVPSFGPPGNSLTENTKLRLQKLINDKAVFSEKQQNYLQQHFNGENQALADYRVASAHLDLLYTNFAFKESGIGEPTEQFHIGSSIVSRSSTNYLLGLAALSKFTDVSQLKSVVEIGGGFGSLGEILLQLNNGKTKYFNFDILPTCLVSDFYLRSLAIDHFGYGLEELLNRSPRSFKANNVLPNWEIENFEQPVDLFCNFLSFQEMEQNVILHYLGHVQRLNPKWILLRHMREGKQRKTASNPFGVIEPVLPSIYEQTLSGYRTVLSDNLIFGFTTPDGFHSDVIILERVTS